MVALISPSQGRPCNWLVMLSIAFTFEFVPLYICPSRSSLNQVSSSKDLVKAILAGSLKIQAHTLLPQLPSQITEPSKSGRHGFALERKVKVIQTLPTEKSKRLFHFRFSPPNYSDSYCQVFGICVAVKKQRRKVG